jgi:enoyl-CoA hydratase/carnithine racemase
VIVDTAWQPADPGIRCKTSGRVAVLRLSRPEVLNALTIEMLADLAAGLRWFGTGGRAAGVVVVGDGRAFSSGDDLKITESLERASFDALIDAFQDVTRAIFETEVPVVAALNGIAVGGAAEIACACDLRVGGPASEFLFPENGLGLTISNGSTATLPALLGRRAIGVILLGERIAARRAHALGLLDVFVENQESVETEAVSIAEGLGADHRSTALHLAMLRPLVADVERALQREREAAAESWERGWPQAGIAEFLAEKRS